MKDLLIDLKTNDLDITSGMKLTTTQQFYYQTILIGMSLNLGEFFTHENYGLPWIKNPDSDVATNVRHFLGNDFPDPEIFIKKELDKHLRSQSFVTSVESSYNFDRSVREMTYTAKVATIDGEVVTFKPYLLSL